MPVSIRGTAGGSVTLSSGAAATDTTLTLPNTTGTVALTASPTFSGTLTATTITSPASTALTIQSAGMTAMTVSTSQNVGIGTSSPDYLLTLQSTDAAISMKDSGGTTRAYIGVSGAFGSAPTGALRLRSDQGGLVYGYAGSEQMRIDTSGNLLVGTTSLGDTERFNVTGSNTNLVSRFYNANASNPNGVGVFYSALSPNGSSNAFFYAADSTALRFNVQSNGGIANYSANNTNLSDERLKKDVQLAGLYLDKICAIPVKTFLYNDQTDNDLNLGVIAQDVDVVAPELVCRDGWKNKDGEPTDYLTIYQTDLQYALMRCIQELSAKNDALEARLAALEAK